ncbi:MAG: bacteriohopanetetrol glucosamine biosynthesis glycosyltransferase HpnI [Acidobacteria bacterium]|nr:bacteriohopanetetrol glucosamine biosynthesis glycosyltransferase HpnI [Acidobacteriota bacterium]
MLLLIIKIILVCGVFAANVFYLLSLLAGARFFLPKPQRAAVTLQPVSLLIPLAGADFNAYENYARLCRQDYPAAYQLVFGVREASDTAIPIVEKLQSDFPDRDIKLVIASQVIGANLKVSNLRNILAQTRHEQIIIVDSDIRVQTDYLRRVTAPLGEARVGLVTCLYRATEPPDVAALLEAIGITGEFTAGVLMARMLEGVKFALGSTMATTKTHLQEIGGLEALADYLADDFMLGNLIAEAGYEVRLSEHIVETAMSPAGFSGMLRHQLRWGRSTRISRPAGYLGLLLTYGTALALLLGVVDGFTPKSLILLAATLVIRLLTAWMIGVQWMQDKLLKKYFWLLPLRDLLSFAIWCLSMVGKRVEWRGRIFEVQRDGRMTEWGVGK